MDDYGTAINEGSTDIVIGRWVADYPDADSFAYSLSREGYFGSICQGEELELLIQEGRTTGEPQARHSIYRRLEETLRKHALLLPLFHDQVYRFARPGVSELSVFYTPPTVAYDALRIEHR
ncbi:MAG: hypothetical protein ACE5HD_05635 [Acidobacteriota bacterium]